MGYALPDMPAPRRGEAPVSYRHRVADVVADVVAIAERALKAAGALKSESNPEERARV